MNYTRGTIPPGGVPEIKHWHSLEKIKPANGMHVLLYFMNGETDPDFHTCDVAYYCDEGFYKLSYDEHLGVLRKVFVNEKPEYWANVAYPEFDG